MKGGELVDLHQWLRYAMPGALMTSLVSAWLYLDSQACDCYGSRPDNQVAIASAGLIVAATLPLGFVISVIMNTLGHFEWQRGFLIRRLDHDALLQGIQLPGVVCSIESPLANIAEECDSALVDYMLHRGSDADKDRVVQRARTMIDTMNGLANGSVAIAISCIVVGITFALSYLGVVGEKADEYSRVWILLGYFGVGIFLFWLFLIGHHRSSRITEYYIQLALRYPS